MARFKLFGINFLVGVDFLCLITFMLYVDKTGYMTPCLLAVFVHEMGHILALKCLRTPPDRVEFKIGTIEVKGRFVLSNKNSAVMLLFGPLTNFIMALLFLLLYLIQSRFDLLSTNNDNLCCCCIRIREVYTL